jgi:hypothetical protein
MKPMSDYYLADIKAEERVRQRQRKPEPAREPKKSQDMKVTLLGDFLFPSSEPQGCDPYNSTHGKSTRETSRMRRDHR